MSDGTVTYRAEYNPRTGYALIWRGDEPQAARICDLSRRDVEEMAYSYYDRSALAPTPDDRDLSLAFGQWLEAGYPKEWVAFRPQCSYCEHEAEYGTGLCSDHGRKE